MSTVPHTLRKKMRVTRTTMVPTQTRWPTSWHPSLTTPSDKPQLPYSGPFITERSKGMYIISHKLFLPIVTAFSLMARGFVFGCRRTFRREDLDSRLGIWNPYQEHMLLTRAIPGASWNCGANSSFTGPSTGKSPLNVWEDLEVSQGANISFRLRDHCKDRA